MSTPWLVVGLGNPGDKYQRTRHNAGARALDCFAGEFLVKLRAPAAKLRPGKPPAHVGESSVDGDRLVMARPSTFMNDSGRAVAALLRWYKVHPENLIVVHDDIDLADGAIKVKRAGGSGGHHGIESIVEYLGTRDFYRVRIGVGRPESPGQDPADYVLDQMSPTAVAQLALAETEAARAALAVIKTGLDSAMRAFNSRDGRTAGKEQ